MNKPRVSVLMVTYNSRAVVLDALRPLASAASIELVVVDNSSTDSTVSLLRRHLPGAVIVENDRNAGFAAAMNLGALHASGDILLLLNPDARITAADVDKCVAVFDDPVVGVVAPYLEPPQGVRRTLEAGFEPTVRRLFLHYSGLSRLAAGRDALAGLCLLEGQLETSRAVDWVSGACMFVRRSTWDALGGLTTRWFMYAEDVEFCLRVKDLGMEVVVERDARGTHVMGGSSDLDSANEPARPVSSAWLVNLYDLYKIRYRPTRPASFLWRGIAEAGMWSRAAAFGLRARRRGGIEGRAWRVRSDAFRAHARAIHAEPLTVRPGPAQ